MKRLNLSLEQNLDDVEQCGRRLCLWIKGISVKNNKSADSILGHVKIMSEEAGIDVPDAAVDRAHRIGQGYTDLKIKQKWKSIIICFI